jgi:hypothetical protein
MLHSYRANGTITPRAHSAVWIAVLDILMGEHPLNEPDVSEYIDFDSMIE